MQVLEELMKISHASSIVLLPLARYGTEPLFFLECSDVPEAGV